MIGGLYLGRSIFIPTIIALLFAAMLWPGAAYLHETGVPIPFFTWRTTFPWFEPFIYRSKVRWSAATMFLVGLLTTLALGVTLGFGLAIPKMLQSLPTDPERSQEAYDRLRQRLERVS